MNRWYVFFIDALLITAAYTLAFLIRFDFTSSFINRETFLHGLAVVLVCKPLVLVMLGTYRSLWSYASLQDGIEIFKAVSLGSCATVLVLVFIKEQYIFPRSILLIDWVLLLGLIGSSRIVWRIFRERHLLITSKGGARTVIVGAGEAGSLLFKEISKQPHGKYNVVGFIDDNRSKLHTRMHGVPILGSSQELNTILNKFHIEDVIIAMPSAGSNAIRRILDRCHSAQVRVKTLPGISSLIHDSVSVSRIKDVDIEDLLGRDPVTLDKESIANFLSGKMVLVSGAGGSIGSEICRQAAGYNPRKIILVDSAETPLVDIELELAALFPELIVIPVIADIRNRERIYALFREFTPQVVFHAAAYKHVPMMEYNPVEAITNNCWGTRILVDAAHTCGVKDFVMISTDKAVNPTNVMGASKRVAELYVQSMATMSTTCFTTVRFGNVLGSNGSVIPLFKEQIKNGGPVTVTDKRIIRYFMTIPEASQLVLQAGCLGQSGEIFVLDMGEPVRILDLAEELIRLSGLTPYEDVDIVFTGLRPGEKLFEELLLSGENILSTAHDKIKVLAATPSDYAGCAAALDRLYAAAIDHDLEGITDGLKSMVPEYHPAYHFNGEAPLSFRRLRPDLSTGNFSGN